MAENSQAMKDRGEAVHRRTMMNNIMENRRTLQSIVGILLVSVMLILTGIPEASGAEKSTEPFRVGDVIYVCGCPMMCCNSYSRNPGKCICNVPLRKGTITKIHNRKMFVTVDGGRVKSFFLPEKQDMP